ncbi:unnamed protein product [Parnassius mnemosyne]|uniref:Uncharacterized protein n=1 Tax=Parnassius mnemosyne TaxID=213953 RepID=A0AAV1KCI8_9NEOP
MVGRFRRSSEFTNRRAAAILRDGSAVAAAGSERSVRERDPQRAGARARGRARRRAGRRSAAGAARAARLPAPRRHAPGAPQQAAGRAVPTTTCAATSHDPRDRATIQKGFIRAGATRIVIPPALEQYYIVIV